MACWARGERTVLRVRKVGPGLMESQVLLALQERRVNLESQDCLATQEDKGQRAPVVSLDSQEPTAKKEPGVLQARRVREVKEAPRAPVALGEQGVRQENQDQREHLETMVLQAHQEREDLKALRELLVSQDPRDHLDPQGRTDCLDTLVSVARQVSKEKLDHQAQEASLDLRDLLGRLDLSVKEGTLDLQGHLENKVSLELLVKKVLRETQVHRGPLAKMVPPVCEAFLEREVFPVLRVLLD